MHYLLLSHSIIFHVTCFVYSVISAIILSLCFVGTVVDLGLDFYKKLKNSHYTEFSNMSDSTGKPIESNLPTNAQHVSSIESFKSITDPKCKSHVSLCRVFVGRVNRGWSTVFQTSLKFSYLEQLNIIRRKNPRNNHL